MRIVHFSHRIGTLTGCGIAHAVHNFASALTGLGCEVICVAREDFTPPDVITPYVRTICASRRQLLRTLPALRADVMHCHNIDEIDFVLTAARSLRSTPVVFSPHGSLSAYARARTGFARRLWDLVVLSRLASGHVVHCLTERELTETASVLAEVGVRGAMWGGVVPNCVVPQGTSAVASALKSQEPLLTFLGRFEPRKGVNLLPEVFRAIAAENNQALFALVGDGDAQVRSWLHQEFRGIADRIVHFGPAFGLEKHRLLQRTSVLVHPALSEGLPMGALEALSYGVPVVFGAGSGLAPIAALPAGIETVQHPKAIVGAIHQVLRQYDLYATGARDAYWRFYSPSVVGPAMRTLYEDTVALWRGETASAGSLRALW